LKTDEKELEKIISKIRPGGIFFTNTDEVEIDYPYRIERIYRDKSMR